jgi:hypothetical protein
MHKTAIVLVASACVCIGSDAWGQPPTDCKPSSLTSRLAQAICFSAVLTTAESGVVGCPINADSC